jgi:hypothetical protein
VTTDTEQRVLRPDQRAGVDYMMHRFLRYHTTPLCMLTLCCWVIVML